MQLSMTSKVILHFMKKLCLHGVSNHKHFYQNLFINEHARKSLDKFSESQSFLCDVEELTFLTNLFIFLYNSV